MEQWETNNNRSNLLVNSLVFQKLFNLLKMEEFKNKEIQEQKHWRLDIGLFNIFEKRRKYSNF